MEANNFSKALSKATKLPQLPPNYEDDDEKSEIADGIGELSTGMRPLHCIPRPSTSTKKPKPPNPEFKPLRPVSYFCQALRISLSTRALDVRVYYTPPKYDNGGVMVFHHGAGYAGTSFACLAKEIGKVMRDNVGVLAFDARRHGKTTSSQSDEDLSIDVLVDDFCALLQTIYHAAAAPNLMANFCTAVEALPHMHAILNSRPEVCSYSVNTGLIRNPASARVSIPSIVAPADSALMPNTRANIGFKDKWRTPLRSTAPYWDSWFPSLSPLFLGLSSARLLVLAGAERSDTMLIVG
ncbi:hypothetical protein BDR06DRAFT_1013063 [Suillus hirtellus]|nr:hypothetical protein BDR06DRAFT_1013063 [Suillus hirtellus]